MCVAFMFSRESIANDFVNLGIKRSQEKHKKRNVKKPTSIYRVSILFPAALNDAIVLRHIRGAEEDGWILKHVF